MITFLLGLISFLHLIIPKQLRGINFAIMEMQGWEPNEEKFSHSITFYRLIGVLFFVFTILSYFKIVDFSFMFED